MKLYGLKEERYFNEIAPKECALKLCFGAMMVLLVCIFLI